jgi:hypothetical protein
MDGLIRLDLTAIPQIGLAFAQPLWITGRQDTIGGLPRSAPLALHLPAEPGRGDIDTQGVGTIFTDKIRN